MRIAAVFTALLATVVIPFESAAQEPARFDWNRWRDLPVQNGGRIKPLDTLAAESLRLISNRSSMRASGTGARLDPTELYLSMLFEWRGWDNKDRDRLLTLTNWTPEYFRFHDPDKWDDAAMIRVDHLELRRTLGLPATEAYVSAADLAAAKIEDPSTDRVISFGAWSDELLKKDAGGTALNAIETKALELANRLWTYENLRMGRGLDIIPLQAGEKQQGMPLAYLLLTHFDDSSDPSGEFRDAQQILIEARNAYLTHDVAAFNQSAIELKSALRRLGQSTGGYPSRFRMKLEVAYNHWKPFRIAWILMLIATLGLLVSNAIDWKPIYLTSTAIYGLAVVAMLSGFICRILISGRPPVTNMYESINYVGFGVVAIGAILEAIYRQKYVLTAAAAVATFALILADNSPTLLDPSVRPLEPVLRSNFWLVTHVMTITLSYAAFALALGIANITLGFYLVASTNQSAIGALTRFTYKAIQVGVLLLAAGIILGGVWADYSWGRFWGWDPKEVWALVALLGYLCVLHARFAGWVGQRGLAALAVVCFSLVVVAWYGVNFVLGAGLHSYGFGGGGQAWVYSAIVLQFAYAIFALWRNWVVTAHRSLDVSPSHEMPNADDASLKLSSVR
jgi:cytochrome c-type biogenesis protein CcsB